ncbi:MAG: hypothetical protein HZA02_03980 [Nitrospinae bacterium]|nr:hypothetical protein [Nitrospinota bacterium]
MTVKAPIVGEAWKTNIHKAVELIHHKKNFVFCANLDPDSVGSMLALALYLRLFDKTVHIVLPEPLGNNLDFVYKIIQYNAIHVIDAPGKISGIESAVEAVMFFDTANPKLLPFYSEIRDRLLTRKLPAVEFDHHFGTDSEALTSNGIKLFRKANANTEIVGELLLRLHETSPHSADPMSRRNILLSLLMGLLCDTLGGKVVHHREDYDYWMEKLSQCLEKETRWRDARPGRPPEDKASKFGDPGVLLEYLNRMTHEQERCLDALTERTAIDRGVAVLNLLNSTYSQVRTYCRPFESDWFSEVRGFLLNTVPEMSGKVGIVCFHGKDTAGKDCIFIKMRRAVGYSGFDLRKAEDKIRETFPSQYMGGGGHAGAVSFRIHPRDEDQFLSGIEEVSAFIKTHLA